MRTEEQVVSQAGIEVTLGGDKYQIAPLVIRDSREWRKKVIDLIAPLPDLVNVTMDDSAGFGEALKQIMVVMPDRVADLFFQYAKDLDRDEIEGKATDTELSEAFEGVLKIAFPLAESPMKILKRLSQ